MEIGDKSPDGSQLHPHIVWFGGAVPMIEMATEITASADILVVVGTSLQVYPAAGLVQCVVSEVPIYVIDPKKSDISGSENTTFIEEVVSVGLAKLKDILL